MKKIEMLRKVKVFSNLSDEELEKINDAGKIARFSNRSRILEENAPGENVFLIIRGKVLIYRTGADGRTKTLAILSSGDFFGEMAILSPGPRSASARALGNVETLRLGAKTYRDTLLKNGHISFATLTELCKRLRKADRHIEILSYQNVPARVVHMLLNLAGGDTHNHGSSDILITQKELAEMVAAAREVVNRTLQVLKRNNLLELNKGKIRILDTQRLKQFKYG